MKQVFKSKVDFIIILLIGILLFVPIVPLMISDFSRTDIIIYVVIFLLIIKLLFTISYVVDDKTIVIKYLFFLFRDNLY